MSEKRLNWHGYEPQILRVEADLPALGAMEKPPSRAVLWGRLPQSPRVSLIGTRHPSCEGARAAFELARCLARRGVCVVSGGAVGIDAAAHRGALAGGGRSLVVAPVWLDEAYPKENRSLFAEILSRGGGYLTVAESGHLPYDWVFFRRNDVLAALSEVVVLGDCPLRSGARNAMQHARRMNKPRFCLPGSFGDPVSLGTWRESHELGAIYVVNEDPILCELEVSGHGPFGVASGRKSKSKRSRQVRSTIDRARLDEVETLEPATRRVLAAVQQGHATPDAIVEETGLETAVVQHQLLLLTLQGLVYQDETGVLRYQTASDD